MIVQGQHEENEKIRT